MVQLPIIFIKKDYHEKLLLSKDIDILSRLLLPLAGPEEFDLDEMDKLPEDLQYLPPNKEREADPDVRTMLIETIMMVNVQNVLKTCFYCSYLVVLEKRL